MTANLLRALLRALVSQTALDSGQELGVILNSTELPYVTRVYPFTHCPAAGEHIRFADLIEWALDGIGLLADGTMPVLVVDARYLNTSGYEIIKLYDFKFLACINPLWFPNLRALVMDEVRLPGEWVAAVHRERGELLFIITLQSRAFASGTFSRMRLLKAPDAFQKERVPVGTLTKYCSTFLINSMPAWQGIIGPIDALTGRWHSTILSSRLFVSTSTTCTWKCTQQSQ